MTSRLILARVALLFTIGAGGLTLIASAAAQDSTPIVRAARLTYMQGAVTVNEAGNAVGVPAQMNLPLLAGVQLTTGSDGQAEVEFEDGSVVRLTPNSALSLDNLAVGADGVFITDMSLVRGLAYCELRATPQYRYSLNAGGDVLSPVENTTVRVDFDQSPATFAVLDGTAEVDRLSASNGEPANADYQTQVRAGESLRDDPSDGSRYFLTQEIAWDSWDQWNEDLDQAAASEAANSTDVRNDYADAQGYGWSDLDANGDWYNVPGQGPVWQPEVAEADSGFDPYDNGAWFNYSGIGYIWASGYSWGWTPYRCGSWGYYGGFGWGWSPGVGCGGRGWGFAGGGRPVNIVRSPSGYRPIHVPVARPGPFRPVLPVRPLAVAERPETPDSVRLGSRSIDGATISRIDRNRGAATSAGTVADSSLRRDFPIDSDTHRPVLGLASTSPPAVHTSPEPGSGWHPGEVVRPLGQPSRSGQAVPAGGAVRPMSPGRAESYSPAERRSTAPAQRGVSPYVERNAPVRNAPQQRSAAPYAPTRPSYSPPQFSRPSYSAPPPPPRAPSAPPPAPSRSSHR